jgi:hypothetical protein
MYVRLPGLVQISAAGKTTSLGDHDSEEQAARAFDRASINKSGMAAKTNFPIVEYSAELEQLTSTLHLILATLLLHLILFNTYTGASELDLPVVNDPDQKKRMRLRIMRILETSQPTMQCAFLLCTMVCQAPLVNAIHKSNRTVQQIACYLPHSHT